MKKKGIINGIIVVIMIVAIGIGIATSYAYFTSNITGQDTETNFKVRAANFDVDFITSKYINISNALPISHDEIETKAAHTDFNVSVSNNDSIKYDIFLSNISISNNLKVADFKWELLSNNSLLNSGDFSEIGDNTELQLNQTNITLATGSNNYVFRVWIENSSNDQSSLLNGSFGGKIKISATNN